MTRFFFFPLKDKRKPLHMELFGFCEEYSIRDCKDLLKYKDDDLFPKIPAQRVPWPYNRFPERKTPSTNTERRRKFIDSRQQLKEEREREKEEGNYQVNKKCACQSRRKQLYLLTELIYLRLLYARHAYGESALILKKKNHEGIVDFTRIWLAVGLIDRIINAFFFVGYNF